MYSRLVLTDRKYPTEQLSVEINSVGDPTYINNAVEQKGIEGLPYTTPLTTLLISRDKILSQYGMYSNWGHAVMSCLQLHVFAGIWQLRTAIGRGKLSLLCPYSREPGR